MIMKNPKLINSSHACCISIMKLNITVDNNVGIIAQKLPSQSIIMFIMTTQFVNRCFCIK